MTHSVEYYAYKFLVQEEIASLPINYDQLLGYCKNEGYQVAFYEQEKAQKIIQLYNLEQYVETKSAFTISKPDIKIILVNNALALNERCFALAHELGHIVLQHTNQGILGKSLDNKTLENSQEEEADSFAVYLLAPLCVLKKYNILSLTKVEKITGLPESWARVAVVEAIEHDDSYMPIENSLIEHLDILDQTNRQLPAPQAGDHEQKKTELTFFEKHWYLFIILGIISVILTLVSIWEYFAGNL